MIPLPLLLLVALGAPPAERPNVLFIFADDHAAHAISAYGSRINRTPNIDRLADEGMLFRNAFCANSLCAPSRATVLTGKLSHRNGVKDNRDVFDAAQPCLQKYLGEAGYQTAVIGKWHLKSRPVGFDHYEVLVDQGPYYNPVLDTPEGKVKHVGYTTDILTDRALEWLQNGRDPDRPFLLLWQHKAPHRNWQPDPAHMRLYEDEDVPEPETLFDDWEGRTSAAKTQEMTIEHHLQPGYDLKLEPPKDLDEEQLAAWNAVYEPRNAAFHAAEPQGKDLVRWKYQRFIKDYLRVIAALDDDVGRMLDYLDESGLAENTVVVYSSDQGFFLGDHGWFDKRWMYEESLRMPLIVRWKGVVKPGSEDRHLVQNIDFAPTFLAIAGISTPADMQGVSLVPLLEGEDPADWRTAIYYHYYEYPAVHMVQAHYGLRTGRYKLIRYPAIDEWELFDLDKDPNEMGSVFGDPAYASTVEELRAELAALRASYGDDSP